MNFCTNCGKKIVKNNKFCTNCGSKIVSKDVEQEIKRKNDIIKL